MQIVLVLKSGGEYRAEHVGALADSILKHNPEAQIRCLTDAEIEHTSVEAVPLKHRWPKWWSKIELFRPGVCEGPTLYLDLDTVVIGRIDLCIDRFTMLPDVYRTGDVGSGVMAWTTPPEHIYHRFLKAPARFMTTYRTRSRWGDQAFIRDWLGEKPALFGDDFRSYKVHVRPNGTPPPGTNVVYFHGRPRPWQVDLGAIHG